MVTNPKIEKKKEEIIKTQARLTEIKNKLREKRQELTDLENEEIVAMFRSEVITEDDFAALMRSRREQEIENDDDESAFGEKEEN
jgi:hypothetical protein